MKEFNWARILVCGLVTAGVWIALSVTLLALLGDGFLEAVREGRDHHGIGSPLFFIGTNTVAGIWVIWLYAAIRPRYGVGRKSVLATSVAWWLISSMQSGKWVVLLDIAPSTFIPTLAATLPAMVTSTLVGAWFYEK